MARQRPPPRLHRTPPRPPHHSAAPSLAPPRLQTSEAWRDTGCPERAHWYADKALRLAPALESLLADERLQPGSERDRLTVCLFDLLCCGASSAALGRLQVCGRALRRSSGHRACVVPSGS